MGKPDACLCKCRVLYLSSAVPTETIQGVDAVQNPLKECYPVQQDSPGDLQGIDAWLTVYEHGVQLDYVQESAPPIFFPIRSLFYCCALRYAPFNAVGEKVQNPKFVFLDSEDASAAANATHPPCFATIFRRTKGKKVLECHSFVSKSEQAALTLVQSCTDAYKITKEAETPAQSRSISVLSEVGSYYVAPHLMISRPPSSFSEHPALLQQQQQQQQHAVENGFPEEQIGRSMSNLKIDCGEDQVGKDSPNPDSGYGDNNNNNSNNINGNHNLVPISAWEAEPSTPDIDEKKPSLEVDAPDIAVAPFAAPIVAAATETVAANDGVEVVKSFHYVAKDDQGPTKMEKWKSWGELPREGGGGGVQAVVVNGGVVNGGSEVPTLPKSVEADPNHLVASSAVDSVDEDLQQHIHSDAIVVVGDSGTVRRRPNSGVPQLPQFGEVAGDDRPIVKRIHSPSGRVHTYLEPPRDYTTSTSPRPSSRATTAHPSSFLQSSHMSRSLTRLDGADARSEVSYATMAPSVSYRYVNGANNFHHPSYRVVSPPPPSRPPSQARTVVGVPIHNGGFSSYGRVPLGPQGRAISVPPPARSVIVSPQRRPGDFVIRGPPTRPESVVSYATTTMSSKKYKKLQKKQAKEMKKQQEALRARMMMQQKQQQHQQQQPQQHPQQRGNMVLASAPQTPQQLHPRMALRQSQAIGGARPGSHARVLNPYRYSRSVAGNGHVYSAVPVHLAGRGGGGGDFYGDYTVRKEQEIAAWVNELEIDEAQMRAHGTTSRMRLNNPQQQRIPQQQQQQQMMKQQQMHTQNGQMVGAPGFYGYANEVLY